MYKNTNYPPILLKIVNHLYVNEFPRCKKWDVHGRRSSVPAHVGNFGSIKKLTPFPKGVR